MSEKPYKTTLELIKDSKFVDLYVPDESSDKFNPEQGDIALLRFKNENGGIIKMLDNELNIHPDSYEETSDTDFKRLLTDNGFILDKYIAEQRRVFNCCYMHFSYQEFSHMSDKRIKIGLLWNHDGTSGGTHVMFMNELGVKFIQNRFQQLTIIQ